MNYLSKKIEKLLLKNECVIVPLFGGFVKYNSHAKILDTQIVPATTEISFNKQLNNNDGLLIQEIARAENISFGAASNKLQEHLCRLISQIENERTVEFGKIGRFEKNSDTLVFSPYTAGFLPENYGLNHLIINPKERNIKIGNNIEIKDKSVVIKISDFRRKATRYAAVAISAAMFAMFVPTSNVLNQKAGFISSSYPDTIGVWKPKPNDSTLIKYHRFVEKQIDDTILELSENSFSAQTKPYHLIVASFFKESEAKKYCEYRNNGIKILKSNDQKAKYRCVSDSFYTNQEAEIALSNMVTQDSKMSKSWILYQK